MTIVCYTIRCWQPSAPFHQGKDDDDDDGMIKWMLIIMSIRVIASTVTLITQKVKHKVIMLSHLLDWQTKRCISCRWIPASNFNFGCQGIGYNSCSSSCTWTCLCKEQHPQGTHFCIWRLLFRLQILLRPWHQPTPCRASYPWSQWQRRPCFHLLLKWNNRSSQRRHAHPPQLYCSNDSSHQLRPERQHCFRCHSRLLALLPYLWYHVAYLWSLLSCQSYCHPAKMEYRAVLSAGWKVQGDQR